ncbi:hypothetical protein IRB23M11_14150 [Alkalibacterium sp. m-11]
MVNREMKDSGVEWIGEIPSSWDTIKLKYLCNIKTGDKDTINREEGGIYPFYVRSPHIERINSYSFDGEAILTAGDGVGAGKVFHYVNGKFDYHQRVYNLHNFKFINSRYLFYYLKYNFIREVEQGTAKSTVDSIRLPMLQNFRVVTPPIEQQQKIAAFLDEKVAHIDNIIEDTKQSIESLKAYKQSLITETVTKGLDPEVEMKDSGVEYIGNIPSHWNSSKLKYQLKSPLKYGANESGLDYDKHKPRYIRITDILENNKLTSTNRQSLEEDVAQEYILKVGDLLFARSGATAGKTYMVNEETPHSAFAGYLIKGEVEDLNVSNYVYYYSLSKSYEEWKNSIVIQATIQNIGAEKYANMFLPIPPKDELIAIVEYLNKKSESIDLILKSKRRLLSELDLFKKSLIYEYVTGKKEVK